MSNNNAMNKIDVELMSRFDQIAGSYDAKRYLSHSGIFFNELEARIIKDWASGGNGSRALDIACGTGRLTITLAHRCEQVVAGDISANILAIAEGKICFRGITNVTFQQINGRKLPFSENTFNTIICFNFLHLIPNDQKGEFMSEFARVLKPGGKLIIELKSQFYGLFLALLKYSRRLRVIPRKCFIPGQGQWLFRGYRKGPTVGVGIPLFSELARIFGNNTMIKISLALGRIPVLRLFCYALIFELYNNKDN